MKAGDTPPKSPGVANGPQDKAFKVSEVRFSRLTRLPGYDGAYMVARANSQENRLGTNTCGVKSLTIVEGIHTKLIVDGTYFMSFASGAIDGWVY